MEITIQNIKDCRKAVNQAKFNPTKARKTRAVKLLKELMEAVTNLEEVKAKPKAKKKKANKLAKKVSKTKAKRSLNAKLERQAQKLSLKATDKRASKSVKTKVENLDDMPTKSRPFGTRVEVVTPDKEYEAPREEPMAIEFAELRELGYSVEDAVRYVNALMQGAPQTA
tara:strand:+ start:494 stop:1000 length:507 start_codon:yes stop_codon:yes gene_type:complete